MTELMPSLAPRRNIKSTFLPLIPMLPSARARWTKSGTEVNEAIIAAKALRPINDRRVIRLAICLVLLESWKGHEQRHHASDTPIISRRADRKIQKWRSLGRVGLIEIEKPNCSGPVQVKGGLSFPWLKNRNKEVDDGGSIVP